MFLISINRYYDAIKNLGVQLFGNNHPRLKELQFYLGCIIEHKYLQDQDLKEAGFAASEGLIYYNWLYSYSHTRLVNLFKVEPISIIYEHFYKEAKEEVLFKETSWAKNKSLYGKVMEEFLQIFRGEIDIQSIIG